MVVHACAGRRPAPRHRRGRRRHRPPRHRPRRRRSRQERAILTGEHPSGTDRCLAAWRARKARRVPSSTSRATNPSRSGAPHRSLSIASTAGYAGGHGAPTRRTQRSGTFWSASRSNAPQMAGPCGSPRSRATDRSPPHPHRAVRLCPRLAGTVCDPSPRADWNNRNAWNNCAGLKRECTSTSSTSRTPPALVRWTRRTTWIGCAAGTEPVYQRPVRAI